MRPSFAMLLGFATLLFSCTSPRSVTHSGRVTGKGQIRLGANVVGNLPSATSSSMGDFITKRTDVVESIANGERDRFSKEEGAEVLNSLFRSVIIYSVDPLGAGYDFNIRYGVTHGVDIGYKLDSGVHAFDARFQFASGERNSRLPVHLFLGKNVDASIGIQVSKQSFDVPIPGLDKLQKYLGYDFTKFDIQIPLAISYSFGKDERYGALGLGAVYNFSRVHWGIDSTLVQELFVEPLEQMGFTLPGGTKFIHSFGGFVNLKLGYKHLYVLASLALYYQNYGTFHLFDYSAKFDGITFIPTLGIQGQF